jgi:hypothetical protein
MSWARALALFFLLFTAADILLPQYFCPDEWRPLPLAVQQALAGQPADLSTLPPDAPTPEDSRPHEEDCFCCCAHVLPPALLSAAASPNFLSPAPKIITRKATFPTAPHQPVYHPPRFA